MQYNIGIKNVYLTRRHFVSVNNNIFLCKYKYRFAGQTNCSYSSFIVYCVNHKNFKRTNKSLLLLVAGWQLVSYVQWHISNGAINIS